MLSLHAVSFYDIQQFFVDFQKKSKYFEMPPETAEYLGIFQKETLIGYFIVQGYNKQEVEINQGYLKKEYRHFNLPQECLRLLEEGCKKAGYKEMRLGTHSRFRSYLRFMKHNGYKPEHLIFSKSLGA